MHQATPFVDRRAPTTSRSGRSGEFNDLATRVAGMTT
jgi:hypothetical protein